VDGLNADANPQSSWVGLGWDYSPGYIERTYRTCSSDTTNQAPATGADLCWAGQVVTMNLGGQTTSLVRDDATGAWHPQSDNGERVELVGAGAGAYQNEYWRITTADGTQYYFGKDKLPGATTQTTSATWTVPVFGGHSSDPCAGTSCTQAWRWNLDYVEDPHHNAAAYYYRTETNYYAVNKAATPTAYIRGGWLDHIDYGLRNTTGTIYNQTAPQEISSGPPPRCFAASPGCAATVANQATWQDTRWINCAALRAAACARTTLRRSLPASG